jgi:hypothetical protein
MPDCFESSELKEAKNCVQEATAAARNLSEKSLAQGLALALDMHVDDVSLAVRVCRVSDADIAAHAEEVGLRGALKPSMIENVRRFALFMRVLAMLGVVRLLGSLPSRTLLAHDTIVVLDGSRWAAVLDASCGKDAHGRKRFFTSKAAVYDFCLTFGFSAVKGLYKFPRPPGDVFKKSTDKKTAALVYSSRLIFRAKVLAVNRKRYTNGHTATPKSTVAEKLNALLEAARESAGADRMRVAFLCS